MQKSRTLRRNIANTVVIHIILKRSRVSPRANHTPHVCTYRSSNCIYILDGTMLGKLLKTINCDKIIELPSVKSLVTKKKKKLNK